MNRRQLIQSLGALSGHALFPSVLQGFLSGCAHKDMSGYQPVFFTGPQYEAIIEIIDTIIPATQTPSASQVNTQVFLDQVFSQCMPGEEQADLRKGFDQLIPGFRSAADKTAFIADIDRRTYAGETGLGYFKTIKQYTLIGFFTSREGETRASRYVKIPGDYLGEVSMDENTLNFGKTFLHY